MPAIKLITDSTADLSPALIQQYGIEVVPLIVQFGEDSYLDGLEMNNRRLFRMVEEHRKLPKTAAPNPAVFQEVFARAIADGSEAIYIGISSKLSSTLQNAHLAAAEMGGGRVSVVDSANLSTGIGQLVLLAADLIRAGKSRGEIVAAVEAARPKVRSRFIVDTLEYLHMGGRCSAVQALASALLHIRPVIAVVDGAMTVAAKCRGSRQKALDLLLEPFRSDAGAGLVRPERVFITHTGVQEDARYIADVVRRSLPGVQAVLETEAGSVIGSHCGPGTIGVMYVQK